VEIIEESWAREALIPPYHIYVKMAYHLSQEARSGLAAFRIPKVFGDTLFEYQEAAVKIAARHLDKRGGVLIGDVVGLGKTLMATALARMFEDEFGMETLILAPKNLVPMWEHYRTQYGLRGTVLSVTKARTKLKDLKRYKLVILDESHNFRNRDGKTYKAVREYIEQNESKCILLSATPYNKTYLDLSNQLRLFVPENKQLGIRPERLLRDTSEVVFNQKYQCLPNTLAAFEKSSYTEDWRELMRLYMVRRTRGFILENYAQTDPKTDRKFLTLADGTPNYFPVRVPKTLKFNVDPQYASLYSDEVVDIINGLHLPRYGLGNYEAQTPDQPPTPAEATALKDLGRAGKRLMGFCRTNLFKRLESSGEAFILSVERHILRNYVFLHAIEHGLPIPIGPQDAALLDTRTTDEDPSDMQQEFEDEDSVHSDPSEKNTPPAASAHTEADFQQRAAAVYDLYATEQKKRFKAWLPSRLFRKVLAQDLREDCQALFQVLARCNDWEAGKDGKLAVLRELLARQRPNDKVLVFTQFADTAAYLERELRERGITKIAVATGTSADPFLLASRFSPESNGCRHKITRDQELRVLIATDVLSEGQNLQDCFVVVNYDLPWAIIRLIQRAGRVDRIGQKAEEILCCSFLPAEGVEKIIHLRERVQDRLIENQEVVGSDEAFFEDDQKQGWLRGLYDESADLNGDPDAEIDLASYALAIWNNAIKNNPGLKKTVEGLPSVVFATKAHIPGPHEPDGVLVYMQTGDGTDALAWVDTQGQPITQSQYAILRAAECEPNTPALPRQANHHVLVNKGVEQIMKEEKGVGGQLGKKTGARSRTYESLMRYAGNIAGTLFDSRDLHKAIEDIYRFPLQQSATDALNAHLKNGASDELLTQLVLTLREDSRLCMVTETDQPQEARIICSMGLTAIP
jgi:superfamily II DNA or RNA helicase